MDKRTGNIRKEKKSLKKKKVRVVQVKGHRIPLKPYSGLYHTRNRHELNIVYILCGIKMNYNLLSFSCKRTNRKACCYRFFFDNNNRTYKTTDYIYNQTKEDIRENAIRGNIANACKEKIKSITIIDALLRYYENKKEIDFVFEKKKHAHCNEGKSKEKLQKMKSSLGESDDYLLRYYFNDKY